MFLAYLPIEAFTQAWIKLFSKVVDIRVQRKTVKLIIIFIWNEVYVVGKVDDDSSGDSDDSK